jgi:uncharacterized protein HemX
MDNNVRHAFGKVALPHSEGEETPPSDRIRNIIKNEQEHRRTFRADMESLATSVKEEARSAASKSQAVDWKLNLLIGLMGTAIVMAIGAFVWLFGQQESSSKDATEAAGKEARLMVVEELRRTKLELREELKSDRAETIREFRRQEKAEVDTLVARTVK